jgi:hypothetical protein
VGQLRLFDREQEHGPLAQVERDRPLVLERAVPADRLGEKLVNPGGRLGEEEAAVATRCSRADAAAVDDDDLLARLRERPRRRAAGDAGSDDDGVGSG